MNIKSIHHFVASVEKNKKTGFSGIGLVFYEKLGILPVSPLKILPTQINLPMQDKNEIVKLLVEISVFDNPLHDGFHLISSDIVLTHLSQFFSTPIVPNVSLDYHHGSRHRSAFYGSFLPGVIACAVCSPGETPFIFQQGKIISI